MKVTIPKKVLQEALGTVASVVDEKGSLPMLAGVRVDASEDFIDPEASKIVLSATNLEIQMVQEVKARVDEEGNVCPDAKDFHQIVAALPSGDVILEGSKDRLQIRSGKSVYSLPV